MCSYMRYLSKRVESEDVDSRTFDLGLLLSHSRVLRRFVIGSTLVSIGIFISATGGSWDISNHLLNKPETFFSTPHAVLYTGVAVALLGMVVAWVAHRSISIYDNNLNISAKLTLAGICMLIVAGPIDFAWHSAFGLDGLLSPPHFVLLLGMIISSLGAMLGILSYVKNTKMRDFVNDKKEVIHKKDFTRPEANRLDSHMILMIIVGILPILMTLDGLIGMFSLPFSKTQYFNFNPDPFSAAVLATIGYPLILSLVLFSSFYLGKRKFGILSIIGASYLTIHAITAIFPNESLVQTIPFYILNILPILASDILLSFSSNRVFSIFVPGAILGSSFLMVQYPLITYVYSEVSSNQDFVWPSLISSTYFGLLSNIYPLIIGPAIAMGIVGAFLARKITYTLNLTVEEGRKKR
jgi:hypothetical protein